MRELHKSKTSQSTFVFLFVQWDGLRLHWIILHLVARWLSNGQVLERIVEEEVPVITFLKKQKQTSFAEQSSQEKFVANVTHLADIFDSLNSHNQSIQGTEFTVFDHKEKFIAYYKKLILWQSYVKRSEYDMFSQLKAYLSEKNVYMKKIITGHFEQLTKNFKSIILSR